MPTNAIVELAELVLRHGDLPGTTAEPGVERKILKMLMAAPHGAVFLAKELGTERKPENIRSAIHNLNGCLKKFFAETPQGRRSGVRLLVGRSSSKVKAEGQGANTPDTPDETGATKYILKKELHSHPVEQFWAAHEMTAKTLIVWAEPLVFFDPINKCYVRYPNVNSSDLNRDAIVAKLDADHPNHPARHMVPAFHYQSSGDIEAVYRLEQALRAIGNPVERSMTSVTRNSDVIRHDVVVVGNPRMNTYISQHQERCRITVEDREVCIEDPPADVQSPCVDYVPSNDPVTDMLHSYGVLTRRPNVTRDRTVTMVAGNHGRALEKVSEFITDPKQLEELKQKYWPTRESWPARFQVLFRVDVNKASGLMVYQRAVPLMSFEYDDKMNVIHSQQDKA